MTNHPQQSPRLKVFVSYATEDRAVAQEIVARLSKDGFAPWYDQHILPGQQWEAEIAANQKNSDIVLIILSHNSVNKRGLVQREAVHAIKKLDDLLPNDIYVIPVRIDDCTPPERISERIQYIDWKREDAWLRINSSLRSAASARGIAIGEELEVGSFRIRNNEVHEITSGPHAYQHSVEYPEFFSTRSPKAAAQLTSYFAAKAAQEIVDQRSIRWRTQFDSSYDTEGSSFNRRFYRVTHASPWVVSVIETVQNYSIGAVHGNSYFEAHNFYIDDDLIFKFTIPEVIHHEENPLALISQLAIKKLQEEHWHKLEEEADEETLEHWFRPGAGEDWEHFKNFTVDEKGITFYFAPYEVHAYVFGAWVINISFFELRESADFKFLYEITRTET